MVGYGFDASKDIVECMSSIAGELVSVWGYDPIRRWLWYAPGMPINGSLEEMKSGMGYFIYVSESCVWNINVSK